jgi:hypothetical protein
VRGGQRGEDARGAEDRRPIVQQLARPLEHGAELVERDAVDVLQHHHELPLRREEVVELHDRRVREARVRGGLAGEHLLHQLFVPEVREQELQHHGALEAVRPLCLGEENIARPAGRQATEDAIAADLLERNVLLRIHGVQ